MTTRTPGLVSSDHGGSDLKARALMLLALVAVLAMVAVPFDSYAAAGDDTSGDDTTDTEEPDDLGDDYVATGLCDTGTGAASWRYDGGILSIGGGSIGKITRGSTTASWSDWKLTGITVGDTPLTDISDYTPDDIFGSGMTLMINGNVRADSGAFAALRPTTVTFSGEATDLPAGTFSGCITLSTVSAGTLKTIGDSAFSGCISLRAFAAAASLTSIGEEAFSGCVNLSSVDIGAASVDATAFDGCSKLATISAKDSKIYQVVDGLLLSDGGKTVHICPPGHASGIIELAGKLAGITRVNLNDADVVYVVDVLGRSEVTFNRLEGATASSITYSSLGMESAKITNPTGGIRLTYELYGSWDIVQEDMVVTNLKYTPGDGYFTLNVEEGVNARFLPMGVGTLTYGDLRGMTAIGVWDAVPGSIPTGKDDEIVGDVDLLKVTVTGYSGTDKAATLSGTLHFHGLRCTVSNLDFSGSGTGVLEDLTIDGAMTIADGAFEYCAGLKRVIADGVTSVGARAFAYCTALEEVSFLSSTEFGSRAFASCWELEIVTVGAAEVSFGLEPFDGCGSIGVILADYDSKVSGSDGVPVVHYDMSVTGERSFEVVGGQLVITWDHKRSVFYSKDPSMQDGVTEVGFYNGGITIVPIMNNMYLDVDEGLPRYSPYYMVVFDIGLGESPVTQNIHLESQDLTADPFTPSKFGYTFLYWELDGKEYDFTQPVTESMVLKAVWMKANSIDSTPIYLLVMLGVSIAATFVVVAMTRRMNS